MKSKFLLSAFSVATAFLLFEVVARLFLIQPAEEGSGMLLGVLLPPWRVIPSTSFTQVSEKPVPKVAVDGRTLTQGDLWGVYREDPVLGYTYRESAQSLNGWWRSNNLGARADHDMRPEKTLGKTRVLVFGESFAHASRVPQNETWAAALGAKSDRLEVANFGVDGYSMAQAYLRFLTLRPRLKYDMVLFVFVPPADLWRDINTVRSLAQPWYSYTVAPRCLSDDGRFVCVSGPYARGSDTYRLDGIQMTDKLRDHLRKYDRFYFPSVYEEIPIVGKLVSARLVAAKLAIRARDRLNQESATLSRLDTEAVGVTEHIFKAATDAAREDGAEARVVFLSDRYFLADAARDPLARARWESLVGRYEGAGISVVDLLPEQLAHRDQLDEGYDGSHYGPRGNRFIAELIEQSINGARWAHK